GKRRFLLTFFKQPHKTGVDDIIIKYLNRLSDYLFVLSRKFSHDLKAEEIPWKPKKI
ncbi:MAG: ATP:cob(I)alamin adenosyltransferase, partial [Bacteroidota bacterium]